MPTRSSRPQETAVDDVPRGKKRKADEPANSTPPPSPPSAKRARGRVNSNASSTGEPAASAEPEQGGGQEVKSPTPSRKAMSIADSFGEVGAESKAADDEGSSAGVKEEGDVVDESYFAYAPQGGPSQPVRCPYLDTVCRPLLDFDMAKTCSVTLSDQNVYACLVCGKFFQGRGKITPLYTHSVQFGHFVVMSLHTGRAYCLPEGYEIGASESPALVADARALSDVRRCLLPSFTADELRRLNRHNSVLARDVHGVSYLPGFVGLNNLSHTDYVSVALHALSHVTPIRDFFLEPSNYSESKSPLVHSFGEVLRKMWSSHNFKSVVSPQEFLQQVSVCSKKRFSIGRQQECVEFLVWLLNELHRGIGGTQKADSSIIYRALQGKVQITSFTKKKSKPAPTGPADIDDEASSAAMEAVQQHEASAAPQTQWEQTDSMSPFLYLSLDIPPTPLFKDSQGGLVIPQIPLFEVLKKFDGETLSDVPTVNGLVRRRYAIKKLPKYLILHLVRFKKNNFYVEKNPSIVTFPIKNLEMKPYIDSADGSVRSAPSALSSDEIESMGVSELRASVRRTLVDAAGACPALAEAVRDVSSRLQQCIDRTELNSIATEASDLQTASASLMTKYDLLSNICHDSLATQGTDIGSDQKGISGGPTSAENVLTQGSYRCHVQHKSTGQWFEMQDLHVSETMPQLIGLSESYLLVYERKDAAE